MLDVIFQIDVKLHHCWVHARSIRINGTITVAWASVLPLCMEAVTCLMLTINLTQNMSVCITVEVQTVSMIHLPIG
jgi:hypothetical protein